MKNRLTGAVLVGTAFIAGCATTETSQPQPMPGLTIETTVPSTTLPLVDIALTTTPLLMPETTIPIPVPESTTTTIASPFPGTAMPECIIEIMPGGSLFGTSQLTGISQDALQTENRIAKPNQIEPGLFDICIDEIDAVSGQPRVPVTTTTTTAPPTTLPPETTTTLPPPPPETIPADQLPTGVEAQQSKAIQFLVPYGMPELVVDGIPGPKTDQQICALRTLLNLPISREDMIPGSEEEQVLMRAESLQVPSTAAVKAARWLLIEQKCQVTIVGAGQSLAYVFPSSSGDTENPTRIGETVAFLYRPAADNAGWWDSTDFPSSEDNPRNGNMYRPLYFNNGQAVHGAIDVPTNPASHGCNRLAVANQDILITWLGLGDLTEETWRKSQIDLTVTVQGEY